MISHVFIGITGHTRAHDFYSAIMDELGYVLKFCYPEKSWSGWVEKGTPRPIVGIGKPYNGEPMSVGNGQMLALLAKSRAMVDATTLKPSRSVRFARGLLACVRIPSPLLRCLFPRSGWKQDWYLLS